MIARDEFDAYNAAVDEIAVGAEVDVRDAVLAWCRENPGATVAEKREVAKLIMEGVVQSYDEMAAALAAEWYDHRAEAEGARLDKAITATVYDPDSVDRVARYQAGKLAGGDDTGFADACGEFARNDAMRSLNETVMASAGRDKGKGVRFARVPTGNETCAFCLMLAGRGAVYHTREKAGEFNHYHRRCDCKVVPGFDDDPFAVLVEGVDPLAIRARLTQVEKDSGTKVGSADFAREVRMRDPGWLMGGDAPSVAKEPGAKPLPKEKEAAEALSKLGFPVKFIKETNKHRVKSPDAYIGDEIWEFKVPEGWSKPDDRSLAGEHTVRKQFYKALGKGTGRLLLSNCSNGAPFGEMVAAARKTLMSGDYEISEVLVVDAATGKIVRLKKQGNK